MGRGLGKGTILGLLIALLVVACSASAETFTGHTAQPGGRQVKITVPEHGDVSRAAIDWIAECGRGEGAIRGRTIAEDFGRASRSEFAARFRGRVRDGRHTLFIRYAFAGKQERHKSFAGTFRLIARYVGKDQPKQGSCRTLKVRWTARGDGP